jgi:deoxycytidine triphosphate deaminase
MIESMEYKAVVITGRKNSGTLAIAKTLCDRSAEFYVARIATTRTRNAEDIDGQYEYLNKEEFSAAVERVDLLAKVEYEGNWYGIRKETSKSSKEKNRVPVVFASPEVFSNGFAKLSMAVCALFSVFVYAPITTYIGTTNNKKSIVLPFQEHDTEDRKLASFCIYAVNSLNPAKTVDLILNLWEHRNNGGVLPKRLISLAIDCGMLLEGADDVSKIQGASYDLSLGDEYYYGGEIEKLTDKNPFICIEPYDYAIVTSKENANFPRDVVARFDLSVALFCQGVILSNGPQVDAGFKGKLFCLLFNTSNAPVFLKRGQHHVTLEFHKLIEPTDPYTGKYQDKISIVDYLPSNTLKGAVNELKKELEEVKSQGQNLQTTILGMLSILLTIIALLLALR